MRYSELKQKKSSLTDNLIQDMINIDTRENKAKYTKRKMKEIGQQDLCKN